MSVPIVHYSGHRRDGTAGMGATITPAAELAKTLYDQRWRDAELTCNGEVVGAVGPDPDGHRTWWGEA